MQTKAKNKEKINFIVFFWFLEAYRKFKMWNYNFKKKRSSSFVAVPRKRMIGNTPAAREILPHRADENNKTVFRNTPVRKISKQT